MLNLSTDAARQAAEIVGACCEFDKDITERAIVAGINDDGITFALDRAMFLARVFYRWKWNPLA